MKVKEIIEQLNKFYGPDDDLYVAWWDIDQFAGLKEINPELSFTYEQWSQAVAKAENCDGSNEDVGQAGYNALEQALNEVLFTDQCECDGCCPNGHCDCLACDEPCDCEDK